MPFSPICTVFCRAIVVLVVLFVIEVVDGIVDRSESKETFGMAEFDESEKVSRDQHTYFRPKLYSYLITDRSLCSTTSLLIVFVRSVFWIIETLKLSIECIGEISSCFGVGPLAKLQINC